jgi:N-acetyl-alpha-D-muramate 1-phosphate uridylyltransferase
LNPILTAAPNFPVTETSRLPTLALLSGGLASRMWPLTEKIPKAMLEVAGEPFVAHQLRHAARQGIDTVVLCVGYLAEQIKAFVGDGSKFGVNVAYSHEQGELLGTGGALRNALPLLGGEFFVQYGDSFLDIPYAPVVEAFRRSGRAALMAVIRNEGRWDTSNVEFLDGEIRNHDKQHPTSAMMFIDYGLGAFRAEAISSWPVGERIDLADIYRSLLMEGQLAAYEARQRFYEIGSAIGLAEADQYLRARTAERDI